MADVEAKLSYVGSLAANAAVTIAPKTSGRVATLLVTVGERVKERQLLARLDKQELAEELREAEASLRVAQATAQGPGSRAQEPEAAQGERQGPRTQGSGIP